LWACGCQLFRIAENNANLINEDDELLLSLSRTMDQYWNDGSAGDKI
jgi:hypothetical protein